jgi:hypothetical protein
MDQPEVFVVPGKEEDVQLGISLSTKFSEENRQEAGYLTISTKYSEEG